MASIFVAFCRRCDKIYATGEVMFVSNADENIA